jgi:hypothetical protein
VSSYLSVQRGFDAIPVSPTSQASSAISMSDARAMLSDMGRLQFIAVGQGLRCTGPDRSSDIRVAMQLVARAVIGSVRLKRGHAAKSRLGTGERLVRCNTAS